VTVDSPASAGSDSVPDSREQRPAEIPAATADIPAATADIPVATAGPKRSRRERKLDKKRAKAKKRPRRSIGYWAMRLLRKAWMPLVILVVVAIAAFAVDRLHGVFGKTETTRPGSGLANDAAPFNPKMVVYEIMGPEGAVATVNYLNLDAEPQIARDVTLPWTLTLTTTAPAAAANIVAQGDSDTIGCRITVDGVVKDERWSNGVSAQTFCIVKSG
jgi:hypothetical protein